MAKNVKVTLFPIANTWCTWYIFLFWPSRKNGSSFPRPANQLCAISNNWRNRWSPSDKNRTPKVYRRRKGAGSGLLQVPWLDFSVSSFFLLFFFFWWTCFVLEVCSGAGNCWSTSSDQLRTRVPLGIAPGWTSAATVQTFSDFFSLLFPETKNVKTMLFSVITDEPRWVLGSQSRVSRTGFTIERWRRWAGLRCWHQTRRISLWTFVWSCNVLQIRWAPFNSNMKWELCWRRQRMNACHEFQKAILVSLPKKSLKKFAPLRRAFIRVWSQVAL